MKLSLREKRLMVLAACTVAVTALYALVLSPAWARWTRLQTKVSEKRREVQKLQREQRRDSYSQEVEVARRLGPLYVESEAAAHAAQLLRRLGKAAEASGMAIGGLQVLEAEVEGNTKRFPVQFSAEGDLAGLTDFLFRLTLQSPTLDLERLSIQGREAESDRLTVQARLSSLAALAASTKKGGRR